MGALVYVHFPSFLSPERERESAHVRGKWEKNIVDEANNEKIKSVPSNVLFVFKRLIFERIINSAPSSWRKT